MEIKKYLVELTTNWCGMDQTYRAYADSDMNSDLLDTAEAAAYENFADFDCINDVAEELGYDVDEMTDEDWDEVNQHEHEYYGFTIEEFTGSDEEWDWYETLFDQREISE